MATTAPRGSSSKSTTPSPSPCKPVKSTKLVSILRPQISGAAIRLDQFRILHPANRFPLVNDDEERNCRINQASERRRRTPETTSRPRRYRSLLRLRPYRGSDGLCSRDEIGRASCRERV